MHRLLSELFHGIDASHCMPGTRLGQGSCLKFTSGNRDVSGQHRQAAEHCIHDKAGTQPKHINSLWMEDTHAQQAINPG